MALPVLDGGQGRVEDPVGVGGGGRGEGAADVGTALRPRTVQLKNAASKALDVVKLGAAVW